MNRISLSIASLSIALSACSSMQPKSYVEPINGPTATIQIINTSNQILFPVYMANGEKCKDSSPINGHDGISPGASQTLKFRANQKIAFKFYTDNRDRDRLIYCQVWRSTTLRPNKQYVANFVYENNRCGVATGLINETGGLERSNFLTPREYDGWTGELGGWCKAEK